MSVCYFSLPIILVSVIHVTKIFARTVNLCFTHTTGAEECANGFPDISMIAAKRPSTTIGSKLANGLLLSHSFSCSGTLTGVVLGVDVRTETPSRNLYPEIALWRRPSDEDDGGAIYEQVHRSERIVKLTPANFSTSGAIDYPIDPPLDFHYADVLGWKQPEIVNSVVRMYAIDKSFDSDDGGTILPTEDLLLYPVTGEVQLHKCM